ncbi:sensor histidine kinase [Streptomyces cylindrosporus]|uniref:histidine kinase n=1 Tax=Streptomyces cylindrosporus TaxID=2927583 RepID=A0ABS9YN12_9ACTN|nr:sensor histidine kinase [Streptomyces cylindrosporus]MCI3278559.1 sensor histidine kinase [Streptomyces cylindrosporus]
MSRVLRVTETGTQRVLASRAERWLRMLRDDLCTVRADPLPPSKWLRWLPHGMLCLTAFGIVLGGTAQLQDNGHLGANGFLIALAQGGAVVLAMWRPIPAWWVSTGATVVGALAVHGKLGMDDGSGFTWPWTAAGIIAQLAVLLLVALRVRTRVSVEVLVITALVTYLLEGVWGAAHYQPTGVITIALSTIAVVLGIAVRGRREARAELGRQASLTAEERARRTLLEERSRIARELHDVVAHHMSVISIQAQVAPHLVENPPPELRENLDGIRANALEALAELRRVLGVLRSESADADAPADAAFDPHSPQPTLGRLDMLVENTRAAGLTVTVQTVGDVRPLPPGLELSAYRIVQEALSNVLRHAPGASAEVRVEYHLYGLRVSVTNTRPDRPAPRSPGAGHGLLGMRERASMLGGELSSGPTEEGGYRVTAFLPVQPLPEGLEYSGEYGIRYIFPADSTDSTDSTESADFTDPSDPEDAP